MAQELIKSSGIFGVMTLFSRIFGFIRDMAAAYVFGASPGYDAFILAFRVPNLMRRLFAEGAFSQAFVPILSNYQVKHSPRQVQLFINKVSGNLALVLLLVSLIGMVAAPYIAYLFAPGFGAGDARIPLAIDMLRITLPYIFFISLTALAASILNSVGRFGAAAFTPIFLNLVMIIAIFGYTKYFVVPEMSLAWAVLIGGVVQFVFLLPFLQRAKFLIRPQIDWADPGVRKVLLLMLPAVFGAAVSQINLLVDTIFASFLVTGSISWLYYADRLMEFPLGIVGVGIATVILPHLSKQYSMHSEKAFSSTLDWGIRWVLLVGVPSMIGLFVLAGPLLSTLFQQGHFKADDVSMSRGSLVAYSLAVVGIMLAKVLSSAFYARQDIRTPVKISVIILITNIILNAALISKFVHVGIALATSLSSLLNAGLLLYILLKRRLYCPQPGWAIFALRLLLASFALYATVAYLCPDLSTWISCKAKYKVVWLVSLIGLGVISYVGTLLLIGVRPRDLIARTL